MLGWFIRAFLLLAASALGGTGAWSQSDGSITAITGGPASGSPDAGGAQGSTSPGSSSPGSSSPGSTSAVPDGTATTTPADPPLGHHHHRRAGIRLGRSCPGHDDHRRSALGHVAGSTGDSGVTTVTGGTSTDQPASGSKGSITAVTGGTATGGIVSVGGTTNSLIGGGGAAAPPDVISPGQDQPKSPVGSSTGEFQTAVDIEVPAFHGIEPHLSLAYGSSGNTELLGVGWQIQGLSKIERTSSHSGAPVFDATDVYRLDDSELVACTAAMVSPSCDNGGTHATRIESYRRITRNASNNSWTVTDRDGTRYDYYPLTVWRAETGNLASQLRWLLARDTDTHNNFVAYSYTCAEGVPDCYVNTVSYNGNVVSFYWESRPDPVTYAAGTDIGQWSKRLNSVGITLSGARVRIYNVSYGVTGTGRSAVTAIQEFGRDAVVQADGTVTGGTALPANQYRYQPVTAGFVKPEWSADLTNQGEEGDYNGDGRPDFAWISNCAVTVRISTGSAFTPQTWPISNCPGDFGTSATYRAGDFNGDGKADIAVFRGAAVDGSGNWSANVLISSGSSAAGFANAPWGTYSTTIDNGLEFKVADFNGDGRDDLAVQSRISSSPSGDRGCPSIYISTGSSFQRMTTWPPVTDCRARVEVLDFNGDGKSDLVGFDNLIYNATTNNPTATMGITPLRSAGTTFVASGPSGVSIPCGFCTNNVKPSEPTWVRADINGDGKSDLVGIYGRQTLEDPTAGTWSTPQGAYILPLLSTGNGFVPQAVIGGAGGYATLGNWVAGDFNGDGRTDLAVAKPGYNNSGASGPSQIDLYLSTGTSFTVQTMGFPGWVKGDGAASPPSVSNRTPYVGDFAGEGKDAVAWREFDPLGPSNTPQPLVVFKSNGPVPDLMTGITASMGAVTAIGYTTSDNWVNTNLPFIMQTATSLSVNDGRGNVSTTHVQYGGGLWDAFERRFLGFSTAVATLPCNAGESLCPNQVTNFLQSRASDGLVAQILRRDGANTILFLRNERYAVNDTQLPYTALNTATRMSENNSGKFVEDDRSFDSFGNVHLLTEYGDAAVGGDDVTTVTYYVPNTTDYLVNYPSVIAIFAGPTPQGTLLAESRFYYDGAAASTDAPVNGDVTRSEDWLNQTNGWLASTAEYDSYGNKTASADPMGNRSAWVYDTSYHIFVTQAQDPLYAADHRHMTGTSRNAVCGQPSQTRDMNGLATNYTYDNLCRQTNVALPDGGFKSTAYVGFGNPAGQYIETATPAADSTGNLWDRSYLDGLGRTWQERKKGPSTSQDIVTDTNYSLRGGTIASQSFPRYTGIAPQYTAYGYDALDRKIVLVHPDGSALHKTYGSADTFTNASVTDELGRVTVTSYDAYGRVVRTDRTLAGANVPTRYTYDLLGHLTGIQDAANNHWSYTYDSLGRKTVAADPDLGTWSYQYDNADRLVQTTDALGQATHYLYDGLDRVTQKIALYGSGHGVVTVYNYDEVLGGTIPNGVGHLTSLTGSGVICQYGYDEVGRRTNETCGVDGVARNEGTLYDIGGRVRMKVYYAAGTQIASVGTPTSQWTYDGAGRLLTIPGVQTGATYTADGQIATQSRPNGVTTTNTYQASRLWLMGIRTANAANTTYQNLTFIRDVRGRILTSTSNVAAESWSYGYDDFDRLTLATNTGGPLTQSFAYNAIGNMTYNSALGNYTYPAPGQPHPHAVTQYGTTPIAYDANGNRTLGGGVAAAYDGENRLVQFATSSFVYGPDGSRLKKTVGSTTTLYFGDDWEVNGGINTFYLPGDAVMTGGVISWLHRDQLGSVRLTTAANSAVVQRAHYKPYGQRLETIATVMTSKGFIGERDDETGLVYLHARYLNPVLGRFITADPSPDPTAPGVGLDRYAYAGDSPIVNLDTSGLADVVIGGPSMTEAIARGAVVRAIISFGGRIVTGLSTLGIGIGVAIVGTPTEMGPTPEAEKKALDDIKKSKAAESPPTGEGQSASGSTDDQKGQVTDQISGTGTATSDEGAKAPASRPRKANAETRRQADVAATDENGDLRCGYCGTKLQKESGSPNSREYDHVTPYSQGGDSSIGNTRDACRSCNRAKGGRTPEQWEGP